MVGTMANSFAISYEQIVSLHFAGRGHIVTKSGGGWSGGGFGLVGALEGVAMARAMNALTTKSTKSIETIVHFEWQNGQVTLLNSIFTPQEMATVLTPSVNRISEAGKGAPPQVSKPATAVSADIPNQLKSLADLHSAGMLTAEEFAMAKAPLLDPK
jgi:hypothetical protein